MRKQFQTHIVNLPDGNIVVMKNELRIDAPAPRPGTERVRITLSITEDEHTAWTEKAGACGMKLTRWAPIALNRLVMGIEPMKPRAALPAAAKTGKVRP